ncbi:MAG: LysE family translocator [Rhodocyclaceae bacterium]|jgi:threonine/homoserine/homoserine lactone efflux protein|nr:LysE family translocator [Rhodocyclaceae bacterium]MBP7081224.1 LysE family translocator [Rhodocyclaceae bacterium]
MSLETILAFSLFAFVTSVTPGPNNLMLLASGVNFGFRRTIPHIFGISTGFLVLVLAVGFGLGEVFIRVPIAYQILKWVGAAYLLYLAWNIANSGPPGEGSGEQVSCAKPMSFWGAAAFQWVNPKAWVMAIGAFSTYAPTMTSVTIVVLIAVIFVVVNAPSVSVWALFGSRMRRFLQVRRYLLLFNYSMAALLLLSLYPMFQAM